VIQRTARATRRLHIASAEAQNAAAVAPSIYLIPKGRTSEDRNYGVEVRIQFVYSYTVPASIADVYHPQMLEVHHFEGITLHVEMNRWLYM